MATKANLLNEIELLKEMLKHREDEMATLKKRCNEELPKMFEDKLEQIKETQYQDWKRVNGEFLSRFVKEYIKENVSLNVKETYNYGEHSSQEVELYLDGELLSSDYIH